MTAAERTAAGDRAERGATAEPTIGDQAEEASLARIFPRLPAAAEALVGPGDDAAVMRAPDGRFVVTTDMMVHGPDFRLAWSTPHDLGWKAAATNLSDVAAMGARPTALVVAIAAPRELGASLFDGIADGLRDACAALAPGCGVVGGDLSASSVLTIAVTAFGDLEDRAPVLRSGAKIGDVVALAGELGLAARGLALLFAEGVGADGVPNVELAARVRSKHPVAVDAQLAPRPPISAGVEASRSGATAMMDISDGLLLDAGRLARASGVSLDLESAQLGSDVSLALGGGEDHGLLACFPPGRPLPRAFRAIGRVVAGEGIRVDGQSSRAEGTGSGGATPWRGGWDPYRGWDGGRG
jgi:thiamine-monophosphate kinase